MSQRAAGRRRYCPRPAPRDRTDTSSLGSAPLESGRELGVDERGYGGSGLSLQCCRLLGRQVSLRRCLVVLRVCRGGGRRGPFPLCLPPPPGATRVGV